MIFWINFIVFNLQNCYLVAAMTMCLKKRFPNASLWRYILAFEAGTIVMAYMRFSLPMYSSEWNIAYYYLQLFLVAFLFVGFKEHAWKKILWFIAYVCVASLVEAGCSYVLLNVFGLQFQGTWDQGIDLIYVLVTNIVLFMMTIFPLMLWRRALISITGTARVILPLIMVPISQLAMFEYLLNAELKYKLPVSEEVYWVYGLITISDVVFLLILLRQEEIARMKLKIKELEHAWDLEKAYYEDLKEKERAVSKVRHDIKNQIAVMYCLLEAGDVQKAKEMQEELRQQI